MPGCTIIDTFPRFLDAWAANRQAPLEAQIQAWTRDYMSQWPELLQKQLDDYADLQQDWHTIASERIFPALSSRLAWMRIAHANLLEICPEIDRQMRQTLQFEKSLTCVIYVGLGCGAGWATEFAGQPAILFGLENIAEENWHTRQALRGLMAHELAHLVQFEWRKQARRPLADGPWWQLYTEGFAMYCEKMILNTSSWHMQTDSDPGWLDWCQSNQALLAKAFLRSIDSGDDMRPFFGSWFQWHGKKQTGYYLGYALVEMLTEHMDIHTIALITEIENNLRPLLQEMSRR